jgi:uncharacterized membrane protein YhaH (DUF805 family)
LANTISISSKSGSPIFLVIGAISALTSLLTFVYFISLFVFYDFLQWIEYLPVSYWFFIVASIIGATGLLLAAVFAFLNKNISSIPWILIGYVSLYGVAYFFDAIEYGQPPIPFVGSLANTDLSDSELIFYVGLFVEVLFYAVLASAIFLLVTFGKNKVNFPTIPKHNLQMNEETLITFGQSIRSGFSNYVTFAGRATRAEYWWWTLFTFIVFFPIYLIYLAGLASLTSDPYGFPGLLVFGAVLLIFGGLAFFLPSLSMLIRRLHDLGYSGGYYFLSWIPFVGSIIIFVFTLMPSQAGQNRYGFSHLQDKSNALLNSPSEPTTVVNSSERSGVPRFCGNCGSQLAGKKFCQSCGSKVTL